jgi:hypothetical protein
LTEYTEAERDPAEHIDQDDSRYDGFRMRELWAATAIGPDDQEGILFLDALEADHFHLPPGPALAADERRLRHLRVYAQAQAAAHRVEIRLRHFVAAPDDGEVVGP